MEDTLVTEEEPEPLVFVMEPEPELDVDLDEPDDPEAFVVALPEELPLDDEPDEDASDADEAEEKVAVGSFAFEVLPVEDAALVDAER